MLAETEILCAAHSVLRLFGEVGGIKLPDKKEPKDLLYARSAVHRLTYTFALLVGQVRDLSLKFVARPLDLNVMLQPPDVPDALVIVDPNVLVRPVPSGCGHVVEITRYVQLMRIAAWDGSKYIIVWKKSPF